MQRRLLPAMDRCLAAMDFFRPLITVTGTTGTGKSKLAVQLACEFDGEVINADALQLYRGLPIATNKLSLEEMQGVTHHLLDRVELKEEPWTIVKFVAETQRIISDIHARGKLPIVVGGTHYYVQSVLVDNNILKVADEMQSTVQLEQKWPILAYSPEAMFEKLRELDPEAAGWWHPRDNRRVKRSLEICLESGRKASDIYRGQRSGSSADDPAYTERYDSLCFHLHTSRENLVQRLSDRVDHMIERGLVEEVQFMHEERARLVSSGIQVDESKGIWVAIGYKEFATYTRMLKSSASVEMVDEAKNEGCERTKISTRQYAVRQNKWVKNQLLPALDRAKCLERFYVFNTTVPEDWNDAVRTPAITTAAKFLARDALPHPDSVGNSRSELMTSINKAVKVKNTCQMCQITTATADQWKQHLASKKHKFNARQNHTSAAPSKRG